LYENAQSNRYDIDEDRLEMIFSIWFAPRENLIITGYYSYIDTEIDSPAEYKTYHGWWQSNFSFDDGTSYDAKTNCFNLMLSYRFNENIALTGNVIYADSRSDFDSDVYQVNIGNFSNLTIERIAAGLGIDYFYNPRLSFYTKYNYRDYNDKEVSALDGELHYVSFGLHYTF
jgi:predicted porin